MWQLKIVHTASGISQTLLLPAALMVWMELFHPNHDSGRQQQGLTIAEAVCTV
jgi:hypothetical protein